MNEKHPWFIKDWQTDLQEQCSSSTWQRARIYVQKGKVEVHTGLGQFSGRVQDDINYNVYAKAIIPSSNDIDAITTAYRENPSLLFLVYQKQVNLEDVITYPYSLGFTAPQIRYKCSCESSVQPCEHSLAVTMQVIQEVSENYIRYLQLWGLNWEHIINFNFGSNERDFSSIPVPVGDFGHVPIPSNHTIQRTRKVIELPPFWRSSFSYRLMLQEIYTKINKGGK